MTPSSEENERLAQVGLDLHDGPLQDAAFLRGRIAALRDEIVAGEPRDALLARVEELDDAVAELDRGLRALSASLASERPQQLSLPEVVSRFEQRAGVEVEVEVEDVEPPPDVGAALARVAAEALENVRRHSGAAHVAVVLRRTSRGCELEIRDDGCGFDPSLPTSRLGVRGMRERMRRCGGTLAVESAAGRGTTVRARYEEWESDAAAAPPAALGGSGEGAAGPVISTSAASPRP